MTYNTCETCGACDGRAGCLVRKDSKSVFECRNCDDTRSTGSVVIYANLRRTQEELTKTMNIINK
jgi:hypothetical protein